MSNFNPGTLVLLCPPASVERNTKVPLGAIGEILDDTLWRSMMDANTVIVDFPNHPCEASLPWWVVPVEWLKPLGGDDLLADEDKLDNPYKVKQEDLV